MIVVACNTATTNAISTLRGNYTVPLICKEHAINRAELQTHTKSIGILATQGTLNSELFHQTAQALTEDITLTEIVGKGLVPLIEEGHLKSPEMIKLLQKYIAPMIHAKVDHIVLGCSHYPYLIPTLTKLLPKGIKIIDSGEAVAKQTQIILKEFSLLSSEILKPSLQFYSNGDRDREATLHLLLSKYKEVIEIKKREF
jgi:glutamate racemase